jgi:hypothetical protein
MPHGNCGRQNRSLTSIRSVAKPSVVEFLGDVAKSYGESYATRFVREITGLSLRNEEEGLIELPSSYTKRKLYAEYCFSRGHKVKANAKGSYGKSSLYPPRAIDEILWPAGSVALPVCCWKDFLWIWKAEFPKLKIRNPCEDTCGECHRIRNSFRMLDRISRAKRSLAPSESSSSDSEVSTVSSSYFSDDGSVELFNYLKAQDYPIETVIDEASRHATNAQNQRALASDRIAEAKASANFSWEDRRFVPCIIHTLFLFLY